MIRGAIALVPGTWGAVRYQRSKSLGTEGSVPVQQALMACRSGYAAMQEGRPEGLRAVSDGEARLK